MNFTNYGPLKDPKPPTDEPCKCIEILIKKMNRYKVGFGGFMIATDPVKKKLTGIVTTTLPKVVGGKPSTGLLVFTFCPFCGERLVEEAKDETQETTD